jgi:phosphate transport system protein
MASVASQMVTDSITAFINEDQALANLVCERDDIIDSLRDKTFQELIDLMRADPANISRCLDLMRIARNLERIADLSTNLCEEVIFMVEGKIIKHHNLEG